MKSSVVQTARRLRTEEFLHAVRAADPQTAVFDFDGTLWPGDAGSGFMRWSMETGLLSPEASEWVTNRHASYRRGEVGEITICGEMVQIYRGVSEAAMREGARQYFKEHVQPHFYPVMVDLVHELQRTGVQVWAVSSTNNWIIEEGVRAMHIPPERVLAACVRAVDGIVTDTLIAVPSDEGKAEALHGVGLPHPDVVFGNSVHDAAMLEMARVAFPVNPSPALEARSAEAGWDVYFPQTVDELASASSTP